MLENGERTYYDRLSRALQHIGRTDIAIGEKGNTDIKKKEHTCVPLRNYITDDFFDATNSTTLELEQLLLEG